MPQARATAAVLCSTSPMAISATSTTISTTSSRLGAKAATAKRPSAFNTPE